MELLPSLIMCNAKCCAKETLYMIFLTLIIFLTLKNTGQTAIPLDHSVHHNRRLMDAHRGVDELLDIGSDSLNGLRRQHGILKVMTTICAE